MAAVLPAVRARVVGALACQQDSYLRILETEVISCVKASPPAVAQNANAAKKKSKPVAAESTSPDTWLVEVADSVLFPEGGGQPADHGTVQPLSSPSANAIPIKHVLRQGLKCLLQSPAPLSPGERVRQEVDYKRRWDHMQQHTGQHLLSAIMDTYDNLNTLGWGMGSDGGLNYVDLPRKPTPEEMKDIQERCNQAIRDNLPIMVETPTGAKDDSLPDDYDKSKGVIRVVRIGDLDRNTCCGTHLSQTSHIALILLHSTQSIHGKNCRLFFAAGDRAINLSIASIGAITSAARLLSCTDTPEEVVANTTKTRDAAADLKKREKKLMQELAKYEGDRIKAAWQSDKKTAFLYRPDAGLDFLTSVQYEIKDQAAEEPGRVVVLASGEEGKPGPIVVFGNEEAVAVLVAKVKEAVPQVKGGGKGTKWQGKVTCWEKAELKALREVVEN